MSGKDNVGPWRVTSRKTAFENPWIKVEDHAVIHPDGSPGEYGVVRFHDLAIGVLPIAENGDVWLVGQHRFPLDVYSWELPEGGGLVVDTPALASAKRELAEETGLTAGSWLEIASFDVSNSVTDERAVCFLAWCLEEGVATPESSELIVKRVSFKTLLEKVLNGEIRDSLTIVMTLTAHVRALRGALPAPICKQILESVGEK